MGPSRHIAPPHYLGRFSNRPFEVKHFQAIRHCNVDVAHGLALLFGIGTRALPSWDPRTRWNNLTGGRSFSMAMAFDCNSLRWVSSIRSFWLRSVFTCTGRYTPNRII